MLFAVLLSVRRTTQPGKTIPSSDPGLAVKVRGQHRGVTVFEGYTVAR